MSKKKKRELKKSELNRRESGKNDSKKKKGIKEPKPYEGVFMGTQRGFGFVRVPEIDNDVFIGRDDTGGALDSDEVMVQITKPGTSVHKAEGKVVKITKRSHEVVVGEFFRKNGNSYVVPDNSKIADKIIIEKKASNSAVTGHKVVVEITDFGGGLKPVKGRVVEILGHADDPMVDIISVVREFGIPDEFPKEVIKEVRKIPQSVKYRGKDRTDFRDLLTVTVDGEDAKDLDDAITLEKKGEFYELGVHIADVSHYVKEGHPLDEEARFRGTSVYLTGTVIPMLPHELSNGVCSLNQGVSRYTLSCMMMIDSRGEIVGHEVVQGVIKVDRRMNYTDLYEAVENGKGVKYLRKDKNRINKSKDKDLYEMFKLMYELKDILHAKRKKDGSIDFDFPECQITLDKNGKPTEIKTYVRHEAHKVIEEFMLAANKTIAEEYFRKEIPFLYRVHEEPDKEKCENLRRTAANYGHILRLKNDTVTPKEIQKLVEKIKGKPCESMLSTLALRSMKRACYSTSCDGHFGLAFPFYCHFTSPIRRYPDLQIHRIIKEHINRDLTAKRRKHYEIILPDEAKQLSKLERRAETCERQVQAIKKVEFMEEHVGETFEGKISGVTNWGIYVMLPNTCEGMIRLSEMNDDYYDLDEVRNCVVGRHKRKTYELGQQVTVRVTDVSKSALTIDMEFVEGSDAPTQADSGKSGAKGSSKGKSGKNSAKGSRSGEKDSSKSSRSGEKDSSKGKSGKKKSSKEGDKAYSKSRKKKAAKKSAKRKRKGRR